MRKDDIEQEVLQFIKTKAKLRLAKDDAPKTSSKELKRVLARIEELKAKQAKLLELYEDGALRKDLLLERMEKPALELGEAESAREVFLKDLNPKERKKRAKLLQKNPFTSSDVNKKEILRQLIKQITVTRAREISIDLYSI